jgi:hypothetical protein
MIGFYDIVGYRAGKCARRRCHRRPFRRAPEPFEPRVELLVMPFATVVD